MHPFSLGSELSQRSLLSIESSRQAKIPSITIARAGTTRSSYFEILRRPLAALDESKEEVPAHFNAVRDCAHFSHTPRRIQYPVKVKSAGEKSAEAIETQPSPVMLSVLLA